MFIDSKDEEKIFLIFKIVDNEKGKVGLCIVFIFNSLFYVMFLLGFNLLE